MGKKVVIIAVRHPVIPDLYLYGRRRDTRRWSLPGGNLNEGESEHAGAVRELDEETCLSLPDIKQVFSREIMGNVINLFLGHADPQVDLNSFHDDPDQEFCELQWLNPYSDAEFHIHPERDILRMYLEENRLAPGMYKLVPSNDFVKAIQASYGVNKYIPELVKTYKAEQFSNYKNYLSGDGLSGYGIKPDGTLINVFSAVRGRGDEIVRDSLTKGVQKLEAADGYLTEFYSKHGFKKTGTNGALVTMELSKSDLDKGSMQRLAPFNPHDIDEQDEETLSHWQSGTPRGEYESFEAPGDIREQIPREAGSARVRFLHKLHGFTQVRRSSYNGKREFLLHRGMSPEEHAEAVNGVHVQHGANTSWTPLKDQAEAFGRSYNRTDPKIISAWINENDIEHVPSQYGRLGVPNASTFEEKPKGPNTFRHEHEVIVKPHTSLIHTEPKKMDIHGSIEHNKTGRAFGTRLRTHLRSKAMGKSETLQKPYEQEQPQLAGADLEIPQERHVIHHGATPLRHPSGRQFYVHHLQDGSEHAHYITESETLAPRQRALAVVKGTMTRNSAGERYLKIHHSSIRPELQGMGLGKLAYAHAAKTHGEIRSDQIVSPQARNAYEHFKNRKGFKVKIGRIVADSPEERQKAKQPDYDHDYGTRHRLKYVGSRKVAGAHKSEIDKFEQLSKSAAILSESADPLMNRVEDKYLVPKAAFQELYDTLSVKLKEGDPDTTFRHGRNKTTYLDSDHLDILRSHLNGAVPRYKVRIRQYGMIDGPWDAISYIEIKLRDQSGETKKVRFKVPAPVAEQFTQGKPIQVTKQLEDLNPEVDAAHLRSRVEAINGMMSTYSLRKQVEVSYQRWAFSSKKVRVTIDEDLKYQAGRFPSPDLKLAIESSKRWKKARKTLEKMYKDVMILEVKHNGDVPEWLKALLRKHDAKIVSLSKFALAMAAFIKSGSSSATLITGRHDVSRMSGMFGDVVKSNLVKADEDDKLNLAKARFDADEKVNPLEFEKQSDLSRYLGKEQWSLFTPGKEDNEDFSHKTFKKLLKKLGYYYLVVESKSGSTTQPAYLVHGMNSRNAQMIGKKLGQPAVIVGIEGRQEEISLDPSYKSMGLSAGHTVLMSDNREDCVIFSTSTGPVKVRFNFNLHKAESKVGEDLGKSKNVREQRRKLFGRWHTKVGSPERQRQMDQIAQYGESRFNAPVRRATGKPTAQGKIINKPDLKTGAIEHIGNPDSLLHEIAHLETAPEGMGLADYQEHMDRKWGEHNVDFGFKQQPRAAGEYHATAIENLLRRKLGLPAHQKQRTIANPKKAYAADRPDTKIVRDWPARTVNAADTKGNRKEGKVYLTAGKEVLGPKTKDLLATRDSSGATFNPDTGWSTEPSVHSAINARGQGRHDEAKSIAAKYFRNRLGKSEGLEKSGKISASELHNMLTTGKFGILSASREHRTPEQNADFTNKMRQELERAGHQYIEAKGKWMGHEEPSFIVPNHSSDLLHKLSDKYDQLAHIEGYGGRYTDISHKPEYKPMKGGTGYEHGPHLNDNYAEVDTSEGPFRFRLNLTGEHRSHPHAYEWHDGHTDHHKGLRKALQFPHSQAHGPMNTQAAGKGISTYKDIAQHFGNVTPGKKTNLKFYGGLEHIEPHVDKMIADKGYKTYTAGGKYGKPDLANKNYNTKHLMVYDPTPQSGGDFGDEKFTRTWRKLHELAHAETYQDINRMYGEGRRLGKLGVRSPREAKRAVHWEHLAAHKQRELAEKLGYKMSDADFSREYNTLMHDAVHRAIHGTFTEPSDEGFEPHERAVPIEESLKHVSDAAKTLGLHHDEATRNQLKVGT